MRSFWRRRTDDIDEELRAHLRMAVADRIQRGEQPAEAERAARREFGNLTHVSEVTREMRGGAWLDCLAADVRYAVRSYRRQPAFALVVLLTVALGIGANSAIFSVINGVVRKPLGYPQPERLMFITSQFPAQNQPKFWISPPEYFDLTERARSFSAIGAYTTGAMNLSAGDQPERVNAAFVTATMFDVLGVKPARGRAFTREEDLPNAEPVVVMSHELWQRNFAGDPAIVGRQLHINGRSRTVVGVMPPEFDLHDSKAQLWIPLGLDPSNRQNRGSHFLYLVARLAPNVTEAQGKSELAGMLRQWRSWVADAHVPNDTTHRIQMQPLRDEVIGNVRRPLWILQGAVALVLLIACANVANLLLARAEARHKELAVRTALGASKRRLLQQFVSEGVVVAAVGAVLGLGLGYWGLQALLAANPQSIPRASEITLDPAVLAFTLGVAVVTGVVFGLAPLLHVGDRAVTAAIREGGGRTATTGGRNRVRRGLVVAEVALAVMLVIGAGLLIKSFRNLTSVDAGFDPANRVTFGIVLPQAAYPDSQKRVQFFANLSRKLDAIPGVDGVAAMQGLPPSRPVNANGTKFEGHQPGPAAPPENVDYYQTTTVGYFAVMGIPIRDGRAFDATDATGAPVVMVNETLAKRYWPNGSALGRRVRPSGPNTPWFTVIGVAKDVKQGGLDANVGTELYFAYEQLPRTLGFAPFAMNVVLRSSRSIEALAPAIRRVVAEMDPALPIVQLRTMEEVAAASVTRQRFLSLLLGIAAIVALTLAAIGTYGVLAYMVTERQREIGIRRALGAGSGQIVRLVLAEGLGIAIIGIALGVGGAIGLSRVLQSLLYGVSPSDSATYGTVAAVIGVVALAACLVPVRRAMRVDPLETIRAG
jgi:predicted permease